LAQNENASYQARAIATAALQEIKKLATNQAKRTRDEGYKAHLTFAIARIEDPEEIKPSKALDLPPGAPIGSGVFGCE